MLVKLLPYLISSLGLHAVFIFHGWELTIWVCSPSVLYFLSVLFDLTVFLSVLFDLSVFLSVLFNLSVLQVSWASNCNDFAKGQFVRKKLFLWVCFVCFVLFACYVWFCLLCVFVSSFLQPGLLITLPRAVCALGALFVWFFVPETSGKTLSQLASIYKKDPHQEKDVNHF